MSSHKRIYVTPSHTKKIFANMKRQGKDFSRRETPLFPTMVVQAQEEMGKGSSMPTDPHRTPIITQPQRKQKSRRPKEKDTQFKEDSQEGLERKKGCQELISSKDYTRLVDLQDMRVVVESEVADKAGEKRNIVEEAVMLLQFQLKRNKHFWLLREQKKIEHANLQSQQKEYYVTYLKNMAERSSKSLKNKSFANIQELFDKAMKRVNTFVDMDTDLVEGSEEATKMKELIKIVPNEEEVAVDTIPLATKPLSIVDWKIVKEGKITTIKLKRADGSYKEGRIVRIKRLLDDLKVTAAKVCVTAAKHKLVLLVTYVKNMLNSRIPRSLHTYPVHSRFVGIGISGSRWTTHYARGPICICGSLHISAPSITEDYVPGPEEPEQAPPLLEFVLEPDPRRIQLLFTKRDDDEDEEEPFEDEADDEDEDDEEEHPALADSVPPPPVHRTTVRISISAQAHVPFLSEEEVERFLAIPTPPASPLTPLSSPLPQIPSLPLPVSPPLPMSSAPPPASPTYLLGFKATMIRLKGRVIIHILLSITTNQPPTYSPATIPGAPMAKKMAATTTAIHLHLSTTIRFVYPPFEKRLSIAQGPRYEVRESSSAPRPTGGFRIDYGFVATLDVEIRRDPERYVGYGIIDTWDEMLDIYEIYVRLDEAQDARAVLCSRLNLIQKDRCSHVYIALLMEREARISHKAWGRSMDASDAARSEVMAMRTTMLGVADALAAHDADRSMNGDDNHNSGTSIRRQAPPTYKRKQDDEPQTTIKETRGQNTGRAYAAGSSEKKPYGGSKPLCSKCNYHQDGQCAPKCHKAQGHFKRDCPKLKNNNRGNQGGNGNAPTKVYAAGCAGTNPNSNFVTGTFLLNNCYASVLFDTGADRSFVSTLFSSQIDITPSTLDHYYNVELADGRIIGLNAII
ncbi:putative reverse transcriptase domain-containing protein [Tanacetum coccineum]